MEEPVMLQSMGLQRVGLDLVTEHQTGGIWGDGLENFRDLLSFPGSLQPVQRHKGLRDQPFPQPQHTHHGHPVGGGGAVHLSFMWMLWKQKQRGESPQIIAVVYFLSLVKKGSYGTDSTGLREKK